MKRLNNDLLFALVVTLVYTGAAFFVMQFHEPWMDEAQAWLVARDNGLGGIIDQMSFEGQPPLWHFLLFPLAHLGLPILSMQILHILISATAVFLLTRYAPFSKPFKIVFAGSYMMFYEYAIVARSYSLTVLLLFAIAAMYEKRFQNPWLYTSLIGLLAWSNNLGLLCAATLGALFLIESIQQKHLMDRVKYLCAMIAAGGVAWYVSILDQNSFFHTYEPNRALIYTSINESLFIPTLFPEGVIMNLAPAMVLLLLLSFLKTPKAFLFLVVTFDALMYILVARWPGGFRHWTFMIILFVFTYWISANEPRVTWKYVRGRAMDALTGPWGRRMGLALLTAILFISGSKSVTQSLADFDHPFSNGQTMGAYIAAHAPDAEIAAYNAGEVTAVLPHIPQREVYYVQFQRWGSFQTESSHYGPNASLDRETLLTRIMDEFGERRPWLLLTTPLPEAKSAGYEYVYDATTPVIGKNGEYFFLYRPI